MKKWQQKIRKHNREKDNFKLKIIEVVSLEVIRFTFFEYFQPHEKIPHFRHCPSQR